MNIRKINGDMAYVMQGLTTMASWVAGRLLIAKVVSWLYRWKKKTCAWKDFLDDQN
jgi:hypothetical protein